VQRAEVTAERIVAAFLADPGPGFVPWEDLEPDPPIPPVPVWVRTIAA
jgi:hypothetical protein